ncbi:MAG: 2-phospho-L-lactate transferase [Solirubrobacterales bacterium]
MTASTGEEAHGAGSPGPPGPGVVVLAGGSGGGKLAAGLYAHLGDRLTVIANTGDDVEALGVHVSPDPDLVTYWLSGEIDEERGWGIREDTFTVLDRMVRFGAPDWFGLSDRDLAACLYRRHFLEEGGRLTDAQAQLTRGLGITASVLPMCEEPVRTRVLTPGGWRALQEYLVIDRGEAEVLGVELEGIGSARPTPEVSAALAAADLVVIGPSNPVISIGPILAVPGIREAIRSSPAPVIAVSPFVAGRVVKGPTERFMSALGRPVSAAGVASLYEGLLDAMLVDEDDPDPPPEGLEVRLAPTLMDGPEGRANLAARVLAFADDLAGSAGPRSGAP